jgi:hypothetical protein
MNDELIYQSKKGIIDFYDDTKFDQLEIDCREVFERLRQKQYLPFLGEVHYMRSLDIQIVF